MQEEGSYKDGKVRHDEVVGPRLICKLVGDKGSLRGHIRGIVLRQHQHLIMSCYMVFDDISVHTSLVGGHSHD